MSSSMMPVAAFNGRRRVPPPVNEPVRSYAPGSPEWAALKARLAAMAAEKADIKNHSVTRLGKDSFKNVDLALFSAGSERSLKFASVAVAGAVVIDNSSAFRMDPKVPLVIPEVNAMALETHAGIIADPNCSTIGLVMALKPIHDATKVRRVVVTTFQSVSGTDKKAVDELASQTVALLNSKDLEKKFYPHQIAFNWLPHIDGFLENGYTKEEVKIANEKGESAADGLIAIHRVMVNVEYVHRAHDLCSLLIRLAKRAEIHHAKDISNLPSGVTGSS